MAVAVGLLLLSFALLWAGGGIAIKTALVVAARLGASPFVISVLVLGFGTSLPELATVVDAALNGEPQMAFANVVGSNIANMLLILPLAAVLHPVLIGGMGRIDNIASIAAVVAVAAAFYLFDGVSRPMGAVGIGLIIAYVFMSRGKAAEEEEKVSPSASSLITASLGLGFGLVLVVVGAEMAVTNGIKLAGLIGVSKEVIALVAIAVGTSLPELAVVVAAARMGRGEVILGNIIGSNIFNLWAILGTAAVVKPLAGVSNQIKTVDLPLMAAATAALLLAANYRGKIKGSAATAALLVYALWAAYRMGIVRW